MFSVQESGDENAGAGASSAAGKRCRQGAADSAAWQQRVQTAASALQQLGMQARVRSAPWRQPVCTVGAE